MHIEVTTKAAEGASASGAIRRRAFIAGAGASALLPEPVAAVQPLEALRDRYQRQLADLSETLRDMYPACPRVSAKMIMREEVSDYILMVVGSPEKGRT
ncbi:hypothetical protein LH464_04875 [Neorhizobium sp. T786]|uniref:hypothetical protein n=1 Tax=Pseudorhizobium xiangyangii TaxID=2883104 RepID=UPI001CFFF0BE|nr:hypothetical protein [Neorhizobium xiangyangii]MCB5201810.1 hypothetical protein [Neorhizobium xiangyangii]